MVKDIVPGPDSSNPVNLSFLGDTLYFWANTAVNGYELWKSDGTAPGTVMLKDIQPGPDPSLPVYHGKAAVLNDALYFTANTDTHGTELWKTDGTEAGTVMVKDIYPETDDWGNAYSSWPHELTAVNGVLYFGAESAIYGKELWKSDGTEAGTVMVKDIYPGTDDWGYAYSSWPYDLAAIGDTLYFLTDLNGLWKSDGTASGTIMVKDITPAWNSSLPRNLTLVGDALYFATFGETDGYELWQSDGTEAGTGIVKAIGDSAEITMFAAAGDTLFFTTYTAADREELWSSDGTESGTILVMDVATGRDLSLAIEVAASGSVLYFTADTDAFGQELWKSDGTTIATMPVKDIVPGPSSSSPDKLISMGDKLYFMATDGLHGYSLWQSDGTSPGTLFVATIPVTPYPYGSYPHDFVDVGGVTLFVADDGLHGLELWRSDGTTEGTTMVKDIWPGIDDWYGPNASEPKELSVMGDMVYFSAYTDDYGGELWKSDGTEAGTVLVKDIARHRPALGTAAGPQFLARIPDGHRRHLVLHG